MPQPSQIIKAPSRCHRLYCLFSLRFSSQQPHADYRSRSNQQAFDKHHHLFSLLCSSQQPRVNRRSWPSSTLYSRQHCGLDPANTWHACAHTYTTKPSMCSSAHGSRPPSPLNSANDSTQLLCSMAPVFAHSTVQYSMCSFKQPAPHPT